MIAEAKLKWERKRNDEGYYYYDLYLKMARDNTWVAEVSQWWGCSPTGYSVYLRLERGDEGERINKNFKTVDDAKAYAEKRVIKHFGLKEN